MISEADKTLLATGQLLQALQKTLPTTTNDKMRHAQGIEKLTSILNKTPPPRVADAPLPRATINDTKNQPGNRK